MPTQVEAQDYKVKAWTRDKNEWVWYPVTRTVAYEIYETFKAGKIYEDHNWPGSEIEYIDGSWIYLVKVFAPGQW